MMISQQLDAMQQNEDICTLSCPYCGWVNMPGCAFCCPTMVRAVAALLDARDKVKAMQRAWTN
jgi:hypothetical protein